MKRKGIILSLILALLLCACVPTPEQDVVVGKNTESMLAAAGEWKNEEETLPERLQAPVRYQAKLKSAGGNVTVSVDADVIVPNGALPIVRVMPRDFTEADVQRFVPVLLGSDPYYYDGEYPKSYWRERLDAAIDAIDHWDEGGMNYFNEYDTPEEAREGLADLYRKMNDAPDEPRRVEPDYTFEKPRIYNNDGPVETNNSYAGIRFIDPSGSYGEIRISNSREIFGDVSFHYERDSMHINPNFMNHVADVAKDLKITQSEAEAKAAEIAKSLGFEDFTLVKSFGANAFWNEPQDYAPVWTCIFTRAFGAAETTYTSNFAGSSYNPNLQSEMLLIDIDDTGVYCMHYEGPIDVLEVVNPDAKLLSFSEIRPIFERMVLLKDNEADHPEGGARWQREEHYVITEVRLGLALVREQNKDTALLVPAWDFLGRRECTNSDGSVTVQNPENGWSFLTINAIDGSIIDRSEGY